MALIILVLLLATAIHGTSIPANQPVWRYKREPICRLSAYPPHPQTRCCGYDSTVRDYIVGGNTTVPGQYPWLVAIEYYDRNSNTTVVGCGGSLISGKYVLTAAHCVHIKYWGVPVSVRLGEYDIDNEGADCITSTDGSRACTDGALRIPIQRIKSHPRYYQSKKKIINDIALIRLSVAAPFTNFIRPICLPRSDINDAKRPIKLYTAGWGYTYYKGKWESKNVLMHVDMPLRSTKRCRKAWGEFVNDHQVCAGGITGKDTCSGDSGGPLMKERLGQYTVVGVMSYGSMKCGAGKPSGFTNVYKYWQWLAQTFINLPD